MSEPRHHHYVPRFYLSGFTDPSILKHKKKETIWVYERGKNPRRSSPQREAKQRYFYSYDSGNAVKDARVEKWFAELEQNVAPIIVSLTKERRNISDTEKAWLALFAGTMQTRTPANRRLSAKRIDPLVSKIMHEAAANSVAFRRFVEENSDPAYMGDFDVDDPEQLEGLRQAILSGRSDEISHDPNFELFSMVEVGKKVGGLLFEMNWQIIYCDGQESFLTSDDPVTSWTIEVNANKLHLREGIERAGANVWLPLSREICLRMSKNCVPGVGHWVDSGIRYINKTIIMCADRWVYASECSQKVKDLMNKKGGKFSVDTVDLRFEGRKY